MFRTNILLDEELLRQARRLARERGVSFATVVREALGQYVSAPRGPSALPSFAGRFASGSDDTAERAEELLWHDPHA